MIERVRMKDEVIYKCEEDGKILAELMDSGEVIIRGNCEHYKWIEVSAECYYYEYRGCGRSLIEWLKENYVIKLDDGYNVNVLISRQS